MALKGHLSGARGRWNASTVYERFEHALILIVTDLIAVVIVAAVWTVVLLALLAIVRKLIILDLKATDALQLLALAAAVLALGAVYWLVRDQDRRDVGGPSAEAGSRGSTASRSGS